MTDSMVDCEALEFWKMYRFISNVIFTLFNNQKQSMPSMVDGAFSLISLRED